MERFSIPNFVEINKNKSLAELQLEILPSEVVYLNNLSSSAKKQLQVDDYRFNQYREHIKDFLFWLNSNIIPASTGIEGLRRFRPIIENLVSIGHLQKSALEIFE